jgi:hypothetical protein
MARLPGCPLAFALGQTRRDRASSVEGSWSNKSARVREDPQGETVQPVSLWIEGSFWDSQIYSGELLLLDNDGALHHLDWNSVIDMLAKKNPSIQTALRVAFSDSDLFYTQKVRKILRDPAIEMVIKGQLTELRNVSVTADKNTWASYWRTRDTPFTFLPTDTDVYYNQLLAAGDEGLFSSPRGSTGQRRTKSRITKHHDGRILQIKASNRNTAVAAAGGADGLFEFAFHSGSEDVLDDPQQIAKIPCSACEWAFQSIVAWSAELAYFASFRQEQDSASRRTVRRFDRIIQQQQIFDNAEAQDSSKTRVWGSHEKIFRLSESGLEVLQYSAESSKSKKHSDDSETTPTSTPFTVQGELHLNFDPNNVVSTGTAPFGSVVEFPDRLVVLRSDGATETFRDEAVHWRVFPRSEHYSNQLHIIYPDRMRIISFVHDYFVEQTSKLTGFARGSNDFIVSSKSASAGSMGPDLSI